MQKLRTSFAIMLMAATIIAGNTSAIAAVGNQEKCPVMGFDITRELFTDYRNKRIYFCCPSCPLDFKKNPEIYIKQMRENKVILEDAPA